MNEFFKLIIVIIIALSGSFYCGRIYERTKIIERSKPFFKSGSIGLNDLYYLINGEEITPE